MRHIDTRAQYLSGLLSQSDDYRMAIRSTACPIIVVLDNNGLLASVSAREKDDNLARLHHSPSYGDNQPLRYVYTEQELKQLRQRGMLRDGRTLRNLGMLVKASQASYCIDEGT